jgi:dienelactone hydrolase
MVTTILRRTGGLLACALLAPVLFAAPAVASTRVLSGEYHLGDTAFQVPDFHTGDGTAPADIELTASVHYPANVAYGSHPLVLLMHGYWETCADRAAGAEYEAAIRVLNDPAAGETARLEALATVRRTAALLSRWPCAPGTPSLTSYRGFDYLASELAGRGYVVVSVSANGINAGQIGDAADRARTALINKHLSLWEQLSRGTGPLAGKLPASFEGHVDMQNVGTLGHSRAGRAVMHHAAENHRFDWPSGVTVKAVVPLEAASYYAPDPEAPENDDYRVTSTPFQAVIGGCDSVSNPGAKGYFTNSAGRNQAPISQVTFAGANHNYLNTQWSPSSGQVLAKDDVEQAAQLGWTPRPKPGHCTNTGTGAVERQLSEQQQRAAVSTYVTAFFRRHLGGESQFDALLDGTVHVPGVDVVHRN